MRWSCYLIPTTKETPREALAASHVLMLRAGLIRQVAAGVYSYLPLGYRALRKVEAIVREEMERAGAIELHMSVLMPLEWWDQTGRVAAMGETLLRLGGPGGDWRSGMVLGPTHEEQVVEIARAYLKSYRQLPVNLFQIQTKFRGEPRPKSGVLRTREFLMKDAYSFDVDGEGMDASYQKMYEAYCRTFSRCGLPYLVCEADSGAIGGDVSHEFMVLTEAGEDAVAVSENGDYAANTERATAWFDERTTASQGGGELEPLREVHTPGAGRVEEVCRLLGTTPAQMIKTLVYRAALPAGDGGPAPRYVVLVRGDHEINEVKLRRLVGVPVEMADAATIRELTGAEVGFAGPQKLRERLGESDRLIVDRHVAAVRNAVSGANRTDYHVAGLNPGRDFPLEGPRVVTADVRMVVDGDLSPTGSGSRLRIRTAIEVGHVFKLGTKYSDAMNATFLTREGRPQSFVMGCYGIGLNRILAAAIESHHDEDGILWPLSIAPFEALVIALDPRHEAVLSVAGEIHDRLAAEGVDVLLDDRDERAGFKFKDADLIGIPLRIVVGHKSLKDGLVEFSHRRERIGHTLPPDVAVRRVVEAVRAAQAEAGRVQ